MFYIEWAAFLIVCSLSRLQCTSHGTEHKVPYIHNIVLYPDKHSWCKTTEIKQIVAYPGCSSVEIDNNVCVGACFSYSIPKTLPSAPGEVITPYCDSCQPADFTWKEVKLTCHDESNENDDAVVELTKKVQVIKNCSCATCADHRSDLSDHQRQSPEKLESDVPELLSLMLQDKKLVDEDIDEDTEQTNLLNESNGEDDLDIENLIDDSSEVTTRKNIHPDHHTEEKLVKSEAHLALGPHHSLVTVPDAQPVHHHDHAPKHIISDDEKVPSLLQNQFKIHDNEEELLDQIAVESRKETNAEVFTIPDLIYKDHGTKKDDEVDEKQKSEQRHHHHSPVHHNRHHGQDRHHQVNNVTYHHDHHHSKDSHKGVKVIEVPHHHMQPAVEGAAMSYKVPEKE